MRRRHFIIFLAVAAAWLLAAHAQRKVPVIGVLNSTEPAPTAPFMAAMLGGLNEAGYLDGQNVAIEYHRGWQRTEANPIDKKGSDGGAA